MCSISFKNISLRKYLVHRFYILEDESFKHVLSFEFLIKVRRKVNFTKYQVLKSVFL